MDQAPDDAYDEYLRQPNRCAAHIRKFLIVIAGILAFWIIF